MEFLSGLGIKPWDLLVQLATFIVTYLVLHFVLFKPYFMAFRSRIEDTLGRTQTAEKFLAESQKLQGEYEAKAQAMNQEFKEIYDKSRAEALKSYDQKVAEAKAQARSEIERAKQKIKAEVALAQSQLKDEAPALAHSIAARLLGRELVQ